MVELQAVKRALDDRSGRISTLRGLTFLIAAGIALSRLFWPLPPVVWGVSALFAALFFGLVVAHALLVTRMTAVDLRIRLIERGQRRIAGDFAAFPERGERFVVPDHAYAGDLDLFGSSSLFQLVNAAETGSGERKLAGWLSAPASAIEVAARQEAARELAAMHRYREDLAADGAAAKAKGREGEPLIEWAEGRTLMQNNAQAREEGAAAAPPAAPPPLSPGLVRAAKALSVLTVLLMIASESLGSALPGLPRHLWLLPMVLQVGILLVLRPALEPILSLVSSPEEPFGRYVALVQRIEGQAFTAPRLAAIRSALAGTTGSDASRAVGSLQRIVGYAELRHSGMIHFLANTVLLWDVWCASALERLAEALGPPGARVARGHRRDRGAREPRHLRRRAPRLRLPRGRRRPARLRRRGARPPAHARSAPGVNDVRSTAPARR